MTSTSRSESVPPAPVAKGPQDPGKASILRSAPVCLSGTGTPNAVRALGARPSFLLGLLFAVLSGAGALVWILSVETALGTDRAVSLYALGLVPLLLLWAAPSWGLGGAAAALAVALVLPAALWWPTPLVAAITAIVAFSVARALVLQRPARLRSCAAEGLVGGAALAAAGCVYDGTTVGCALAFWVACLVEIAGTETADAVKKRPSRSDCPFEVARERALRILEAEETRPSMREGH